jgi:hypothetical protein
MANVITRRDMRLEQGESHTSQAYAILHWGFVALPVIAGLDKFAHMLVDWNKYLAPQAARMLGGAAHGFMLAVGGIEIVAGLLVAIRPRLGAYVVGAWLVGIIVNLVMGGWYDIALRDFGLCLGALALARLASGRRRGWAA